jgi:hypothetical protein
MNKLKKLIMMANQGDLLPPSYEKIDYCSLDGYIVLPIIFTDVASFDIDVVSNSGGTANQSVIYANAMKIGIASNFWGTGVSSATGRRWWYLTDIHPFTRIKATLNVLGSNMMSGTFYYNEDGTAKTHVADAQTINYNSSEVTLGCDRLNASNRAGTFHIYYFKITTVDGKVYTFQPAKEKATNRQGLYCYELKEFFNRLQN